MRFIDHLIAGGTPGEGAVHGANDKAAVHGANTTATRKGPVFNPRPGRCKRRSRWAMPSCWTMPSSRLWRRNPPGPPPTRNAAPA